MFAPCDKWGNVLEEPNFSNTKYQYDCDFDFTDVESYKKDVEKYNLAKERCLFEFNSAFLSFEKSDMENNTVEDLLSDGYDYILTQTALKQIGL